MKGGTSPVIGVLNLQGGVQEHLEHLERIGVSGSRVKRVEDFDGLAGLIIPGGESTCLSRLIRILGLEEIIVRKHRQVLILWGTCAGAILLAADVAGESPHLGLIDISIERNAFGSQLDSFTCEGHIPRVSSEPVPLTFIRAPKITRVGSGVEVLMRLDDYVTAAESGGVLVTVFHPELTPGLAFHRYFANKCGLHTGEGDGWQMTDPLWTRKSWTRFAPI